MKTLIASAALLAGLTTVSAGLAGPAGVKTGDPAPNFEGEFLNLSARSLADLRGRVVLIDFWRTW